MKTRRLTALLALLFVFAFFGCESRKSPFGGGAKSVEAEDAAANQGMQKVYPPGQAPKKISEFAMLKSQPDNKKAVLLQKTKKGGLLVTKFDAEENAQVKALLVKVEADKPIYVRDALAKTGMGAVTQREGAFVVRVKDSEQVYVVSTNPKNGIISIIQRQVSAKKEETAAAGETATAAAAPAKEVSEQVVSPDPLLIIPNKKNKRVVVKKGWKSKDNIAVLSYNPKSKRVAIKDNDGKLLFVANKGWFSPVFALAATDLPDQVKVMAMLELYRQDMQS